MENFESILFDDENEHFFLSKKREINTFLDDILIEKTLILKENECVAIKIIEEITHKEYELNEDIQINIDDLNYKIFSICFCFEYHCWEEIQKLPNLSKSAKIDEKTVKLLNSCLSFKLLKPKCYVTINKNGNVNVFGVKKEDTCEKIIKVIQRMTHNNEKIENKPFKYFNLIGSVNLGFSINLMRSAEIENFIFDPELYSKKLIYHSQNPKMTLELYKKGLVKFVGAKSKEDVNKVIKHIYPLLKKRNLLS